MGKATIKRSVGRRQTINPDDVWPKVLDHIASGDALSTALQRLDPVPSCPPSAPMAQI